MCPSLLSARGQACATTTWEYTLYIIVLFRFLVHLLIWIVCFLQLCIIFIYVCLCEYVVLCLFLQIPLNLELQAVVNQPKIVAGN